MRRRPGRGEEPARRGPLAPAALPALPAAQVSCEVEHEGEDVVVEVVEPGLGRSLRYRCGACR
jgi:hypothetical protein